MRGTGFGIPPYGDAAAVHGDEGKTQHTDLWCFPHGQSEGARQRRMEKAETTTDIAKWNQISEAQVERGELGDAEMVCGLVPQCSLGLQGTRRCCVYNGKRSNDELLEKCEVKHEKLDGDRTIYIGHVHA